jgi:hypothetical protein
VVNLIAVQWEEEQQTRVAWRTGVGRVLFDDWLEQSSGHSVQQVVLK